MIFHNYKTIFIHIPKAGGTSIENLMWPKPETRTVSDLWMGFIRPHFNKYQTGGLQHLLAKQIREEVGLAIFNSYYKFSVVRNPWEKSVSQFVYMSSRNDLRSFINMKNGATFMEYLELISKIDHVQWKPQVEFILDDNGELIVDDVFRLEEIKNNYDVLTSKTGANFTSLQHVNKGRYNSFKDYLTEESVEIISEIYKYDIECFNYSYE